MAQDGNNKYNISGAQFTEQPEETVILGTQGLVADVFKRVLPRTAIYVTPADRLLLNCTIEIVGSPIINLAYRLLLTDGTIQTSWQAFPYTNSSGGVGNFVNLPEGWLLSVTVECNTARMPTGAIYAQVFLTRGQYNDLQWCTQLIGEYVNSFFHIGWPGTPIRIPTEGRGWANPVVIANPAAGANLSIPSDQRFRVKLMALQFQLQTSAVAGNRSVRLILGGAAFPLIAIPAPATQAASLTLNYTYAIGMPFNAGDPTFGFTMPLPDWIEWATNATVPINTVVGNLDVGDQIKNIALWETTWIEAD